MRWLRFSLMGGVLLLALLLTGPLLNAAMELADHRPRADCQTHLKQLATGLLMYTQDYDNRFPPAAGWDGNLMPYLRNSRILRCPADSQGSSYAYNRNLSRRPLSTIVSPTSMPTLFDSSLHLTGANGTAEAAAAPPRHFGGNNFAYVDGHVNREASVPDFGRPYVPPARPKPLPRSR